MDTILCLEYYDRTCYIPHDSGHRKVLAALDTGIAIAISGFFISAGSIILVSLGMRRGTKTDDYAGLERRIQLCEEDRKQLRIEISSLRDSNLWLTQQLTGRAKE